MKRPLVVANWKMNGTEEQAREILDGLLPLLLRADDRRRAGGPRADDGPRAEEGRRAGDGPRADDGPEIALAPPFTSLRSVGERLRGTGIALAAQNLHPATHGAFTGEISGAMLSSLGVRYVIVGHSERRRLFGESDDLIARKASAAAVAGLVPILCVGEEESDRMGGHTLEVIERQVSTGIGRLSSVDGGSLVVAYEPVWAIGTGRTATPAQISEAHEKVRDSLARGAGTTASGEIRILYGGSVTAESAGAVFRAPGVDGALVGGASLVPESFARIVSSIPL